MKVFNRSKGQKGENLAEQFLAKQKYKIIDRNYRGYVGEIDLIALDKETIVFIEVKTRETLAFGRPSEAVNVQKQNKIRKTAEEYLAQKKVNDVPCRFDVVEVFGKEINHIKNAF